jgi:hypothetical protein
VQAMPKKKVQLPGHDQPTMIKYGLQIYLYKRTRCEASYYETKPEAQNNLPI